MKRFLSLLLCICMVFSLVACSAEDDSSEDLRERRKQRQKEANKYGTFYIDSVEGIDEDEVDIAYVIIEKDGVVCFGYNDGGTELHTWEDGYIYAYDDCELPFTVDGDTLTIIDEEEDYTVIFIRGEDKELPQEDEDEEDDKQLSAGTDFDGTLTIGLPKSALVTDYYENYYTQWLEEKTGYNIEFQFFASNSNDYKTQINTMVAGKLELPDILWSMNLGQSIYERYGKDGVLVDVSDYFNDKTKSAPFREQLSKLSQEVQDNTWRRMQSHDGSGAIYAFPEIQESLVDTMDYQVWINREWLETLKLDMPTDAESLYNVLKAFKTGDPNGNGVADEIPLIGTAGSLCGDTMSWLINMFIYCDESKQWNVDENGYLYLPQTTDAYREALTYIRKLYKEGLLSPLTLSSSSADLQQMVCPTGDGPVLAGVVVTHLLLGFVQGHEGLLQYEALPLWGNAVINEAQYSLDTFITKDCQNIDAAWELLMVMYSEESALIQRYGREGISWDWAPKGSKSVIGDAREAQIRLYNDTWGTQGNDNWKAVGCTILYNAEGEAAQSVPAEETPVNVHKYKLYNDMLDSYEKQQKTYNPKILCPALVWPENYKEQLPTQRSDCPSVITKYRTDFIIGKLNIESDADWNAYLNQLKSVGVEDWQYYAQLIYNEMK